MQKVLKISFCCKSLENPVYQLLAKNNVSIFPLLYQFFDWLFTAR
ncbi:hypothetical protein HMPREF0766_11195 [Sphingobacterium spiritivorum ATCC 33861]|uniref:Uncharacterized protein n=1 Tax=Sphingobacterium spiritivorum ATCC 33861 TaxID=525373 RepID=D7VJM6_SPHSI|nr:hypothetical protein HMPREF0766_11195 [Sphingobacterium spiritivorum ATCC 33861]